MLEKRARIRRLCFVLDPTLRILKVQPLIDAGDMPALLSYLAGLPPPSLFAGIELQAPILVLPNVFKFFAMRELTGVTVTPDINAFLSFTLGMVFAFGLAFQVPIIVIIIAWTGLVSRKALKSARPYVFLAVFVIAAVLTPPDVFSQTLLAVPMYVLYEIALLACARFLPDRD